MEPHDTFRCVSESQPWFPWSCSKRENTFADEGLPTSIASRAHSQTRSDGTMESGGVSDEKRRAEAPVDQADTRSTSR